MSGEEIARYLASSPERYRTLAAVAEAPATPAGLADALSLSRRSAQRHLGAFEDRDWVEKADGEYAITAIGSLVLQEHERYLAGLDRIEEYERLYSHLPGTNQHDPPDPGWLASGTLTAATGEDPQAPVRRYLDEVRSFDTDEVRMLSPVLSRLYHDAHAELALAGVTTDLVLPATAVERARAENPVEFAAVVTVGVLDLYRYPEDVPVGLTISDDRVLVCAYDDDGQLKACLEGSNDDLLAWADRVFETYRSESEPVDSPVEPPA